MNFGKLGWGILFLLAGCVTTKPYSEGLQSIQEGRLEEGLASLQRLSIEDPANPEFRQLYVLQRDALTNRLLAQADSARLAEQYDLAESLYLRAMGLDKDNARASGGLASVAKARRHRVLLAEAQELLLQGKVTESELRVRQILLEDPNNTKARQLNQTLQERLVVSRPVHEALNARFKKMVSLEFREANVRTVFEVLSQASGINFVFDQEVRPDAVVTIHLKNASIEEAFRMLLTTSQLGQKVLNDNTILIFPNTPEKLLEYQEMAIRGFYLSNGNVRQAMALLRTVLKAKDVYVDERLNLLVIRDTPEAIRIAEKLLALQDISDSEVILEVEVLEVSRRNLRDLGVSPPAGLDMTINGPLTNPSSTTVVDGTVVTLTGDQTQDPLTLKALKSITSSQVTVAPISVGVRFRLEQGDTNVLANPRIRVKNREKAKVHIGERVPIITTTVTSAGNTNFLPETVNYLDVGIKLEVETNVQLSDYVDMKVSLEVSSLGQKTTTKNGSEVYRVGTRNVATTLKLRDGETQALAGLISNEERNSVVGIPGLGEIPALGRLFSTQGESKDKTEIVLLITPKIVRNVDKPQSTALEFGTIPDRARGAGDSGGGLEEQPPTNQDTTAQSAPLLQPLRSSPEMNGRNGR